MKPLVSIIIPLFNRADMVKETLNSVIAQTYAHWEALVVDDGSDDNSQQVIESFVTQDERIRFFQRHRPPKGANTCRNIGIENAKGEYLIFLDSDDWLAPWCLEQRVKIMLNNDALDFGVFQMLIVDEYKPKRGKLFNTDSYEKDLYRFFRIDTVWAITGPIWKKKVLQELNGFDESLACWQDLELNLRALKAGVRYKKFLNMKPDCYLLNHQINRITNLHQKKKASINKIINECVTYAFLTNDSNAKFSVGIMIYRTIQLFSKNDDYHYAVTILRLGLKIFSAFYYSLFLLFIYLHKKGINRIRGFYSIFNLVNKYKIKSRWSVANYEITPN